MKNRNTRPDSLRNLARRAGVSIAAVSYAFQNKPGVSNATRERIMKIAKDLNYAPDARIGSWMARIRSATSKDLVPIVWINTSMEKDAWHRYRFHTPYLEGAKQRAMELGYKLDEIWIYEPGMTMKRLSKILYQSGIEGAIVSHHAKHFRLDWDNLASVALGASLLVPQLHRVAPDLTFNLQLALKSLKRIGYKRIGICFAREIDIASQYGIRAVSYHHNFETSPGDQIPPLFHEPSQSPTGGNVRKEIIAWLKRYKPDVIVCHDCRLKEWVEDAGFRVPEDVGIVHLAVDDDVLEWAGNHSRRRKIGETAVDWLVTLMRNHQFGVPETPLNILIRGIWQGGETIQTSEAKNTRGRLKSRA